MFLWQIVLQNIEHTKDTSIKKLKTTKSVQVNFTKNTCRNKVEVCNGNFKRLELGALWLIGNASLGI